MRALFGGDPMLTETNGIVRLNKTSRTLTFYDAETGGAQVTDLLAADGTTPVSTVVTTGAVVPPFYGPDGVVLLWADAGDGNREPMTAALDAAYARGVNLPEASGSDDAAAINAVLADNPGRYVKAVPGAAYQIGSPLIVQTGQTLDMAGASVTRITGTTGNMLRNASYETAGRDSGITVIGGTWDKNATTGGTTKGTHFMIFHNVDGIEVRDCVYADPGTESKFCLLFANVTKYRARNLTFDDTPSDGVHVHGPAEDGLISGIFGTTGDDMVSVTASEYTAYQHDPGGGDVRDLVVENVYPDGCGAAVKLLPGQYDTGDGVYASRVVQGVTIRNVYGVTAVGNAIALVDDVANTGTTGGFLDDITVENVRCSTPEGFGISVGVSGADGVGTVRLRNIAFVDATTRIKTGYNIDRLEIDGLTAINSGIGRHVEIQSTSVIGSLVVRGVKAVLGENGYLVHQSGTVENLSLSDLDVTGVSGSAVVVVGGTLTAASLRSARLDAGYGFYVTGASSALDATVDGITLVSGILTGVTGASASAILRGGNVKGGTLVYRTGTQSLRAVGGNLQTNVALLTPSNGDSCYNTNGAATGCPFVGQVVHDGSAWRAARGYFKTGIATLADGTVTVSEAAITGTSRIRLEMYAPGGTVGYQYVSARTADTSFTITSTSGTDTSQVRWELVQP